MIVTAVLFIMLRCLSLRYLLTTCHISVSCSSFYVKHPVCCTTTHDIIQTTCAPNVSPLPHIGTRVQKLLS